MSLEENKKIVHHYQEIYNSNDLDSLDEVVAKDLLTPKIMVGIPTGIEGAKAAHRIMLAGFPDYQTVIDDLIAEDDKVVTRYTLRMPTAMTTGIWIDRIQDNKIVESWVDWDRLGFFRQLGIVPS